MSGFRRFRSRVAFGLVVALFAAEVPAVASAAEEPARDVGVVSRVAVEGPGEDALPLWEREVSASEVVGDAPSFDRSAAVEVSRAVDRVVWRNPDGSFTARVYGGPVNFRDEQGRWRGIDTRLVDDGGGGFVNVAGPFGVRFDESGDAAGLVSLRDGDVSLSFGFDGVGSAERRVALARQTGSRAEVAGGDARDVMRYAAVLPGARLEYQVGADRLKEMVVLDRPLPEGAGSSFRFPLRTEGLVPSLEGDGSVVFRDGAGEVRFTVPAGVAFDSSRLAENFGLAASTPVTTSLDQQPGGGWVLSLTVEERWLADPARVYPVYVDPSYVVSKYVSDDATVLAEAPGNNYNGAGQYDSGCGCYYARVGYSWPGVNWYSYAHYSGLDWFDGKDIVSATWKGYAYQTNVAPTSFTLRPISGSWSANTVTYDTRPSVRAESASGSVTANGQWVSRSITTWVRNWADDTWANYGIRIHGPGDDYIWFAAQEQTNRRSYVEVTYNSYPKVPTNLAPGSGSWTDDSTPELRAKVSDPDGGQVRGRFEVASSCGGTAIRYGNSAYVASGQTAVWSPSNTLADGTYYWRVRAYDGSLYSGYSSCAVIKVDTGAPADPPGVSSSTWTEDAWNTATSGTFTFTNGGVGDVVGWYWGLDVGDVPANYTTSSTVNVTPGAGWHDLAVRSKDAAGNVSPVTHYEFGSQSGAIVGMGDGDITQKHFAFTVEGTSSFDGVGLLWRRSEAEAWQGVPDGDVRFKSSGQPIGSWPVTISGSGPVRTSAELVWDVAATAGGVDGPIQVFGWFTIGGQLAGGITQVVTGQLDQASFGGQTAAAGPGSVDLITGNMTLSASDASMGAVGVVRTFQSRDPNAAGSVFGPGWTSGLTANGFVSLHDESGFVNVTLVDGGIMSFREQADGSYEPQPDAIGATLAKTGNDFTLTTLDGVVVTFSLPSGGTDYLPVKVDPPAASDDTNMAWEVVGNLVRPTRTTAPAPSGVDCTTAPLTTRGCESLTFEYATSTTATGTSEPDWGDYAGRLQRVNVVVWDPDANPATMVTIAVAEYLYDSDGRLRAAWDPQISPALETTYGYDSNGHVVSVTPPGQEPWEFTYQPLTGEPASTGRLRTVECSNLQSGETVTTFVYEVPVTGSGAPSDLAPGEVERWAQTVAPTDATAVFPPDQIPSGNPPSSYEYATVYYMDANGRQTNVAQPGGGITTISYDQHGNVIAELSAQNRQRALDWGQNAYQEMLFAISLSQRSVYSDDGIDVVDEYGPARDVDIDGTTVRAWPHTHYTYDEDNRGIVALRDEVWGGLIAGAGS